VKINHAIISLWYKELEYNPICKVGNLENSLSNYFKVPFLISDKEPFVNISLPRIMAGFENDKYLYNFNMSMVNANLNITFNEVDKDEIILKVNEMIQIMYDVLKEIYDIDVIYSSIKIEYIEQVSDIINIQKELLANTNDNLEDFMLKRSFQRDDKYYVNEIITVTKEVKVDINFPKNIKPNDGDMIARSMLISLENSKVLGNIKNTILEINDRLSYNKDSKYRVTKDSLRNLLFEFKLIVDDYIK